MTFGVLPFSLMCMCACDTLLIVLIHNIKGDSEGQGILACCSPWGRRVGHDLATEQQQGGKNVFSDL